MLPVKELKNEYSLHILLWKMIENVCYNMYTIQMKKMWHKVDKSWLVIFD